MASDVMWRRLGVAVRAAFERPPDATALLKASQELHQCEVVLQCFVEGTPAFFLITSGSTCELHRGALFKASK